MELVCSLGRHTYENSSPNPRLGLYRDVRAGSGARAVPLCRSRIGSKRFSRNALQWIGPLFLLFACLGLIPGLVGGISLLRSQSWARVFLLIPSAILLPLLPVGTAIGIYGFWTLLHPETPACMAGSPRTSRKPFPRTPSSTHSLLG